MHLGVECERKKGLSLSGHLSLFRPYNKIAQTGWSVNNKHLFLTVLGVRSQR